MFTKLQLGVGLPAQDFADYKDSVLHNGKLDDKHLKEQQDQAKKNYEEYQALKQKSDAKETLSDADKTRLDLGKDVQEDLDSLKQVSDGFYKESTGCLHPL